MRYHAVPTRMARIKKKKIKTSVGEDVEKSCNSCENVNDSATLENDLAVSQTMKIVSL